MSIISNIKTMKQSSKQQNEHVNAFLSDNIIGYNPSEILQATTKY